MSLNKVLEEIKEKGITAVRFEQTDLKGIARSKLIHARHFKEKAMGGLNFSLCHLGRDVEGTVITGTGYSDEEVGYSDAVTFPDYSTFKVLPWAENTARILIEPTFNGEYVSAHPRVLARKQLEKLKKLGYSLFSAHEHEFYVVDKKTKKPINNDINIESTLRMIPIRNFVKQVMEDMPDAGIDIEKVECANDPAQVKITYKPAFGIRAADNAFTFKTGIKEIALLQGYQASFMSEPLPHPYNNGSCTYFSHSLYDTDEKNPIFYDPSSAIGLSEVGQNWAAGILVHAPAIKVLHASTKSILETSEDLSKKATWGISNRSAMLRVKVKGDTGTYIQNRAGASGANCYLVLAATVAAGMDGIINKYKLPAEVGLITGLAENTHKCPYERRQFGTVYSSTMKTAMQALLNDEVIREAFGEDFIKCFSAVKLHEAQRAAILSEYL